MNRQIALLLAAAAGLGAGVLTAVVMAPSRPEPAMPAGLESAVHESLEAAAHENLNAVLWVQGAAEYEASALQAYALAGLMLERGLADRTWSASLEQLETGGFGELPPAVILDVDETVLDNSPYQARQIVDGFEFSTATWHDWVREEAARTVPGAFEFTTAAAERGVTVFYVTNRRAEVEEATRANLERLGFPFAEGVDTLYTRDERPDWGSDKGTRRREVAARHRILLLIGDNLGDFFSDVDRTPETRHLETRRHESMWGTRWIVLPNPEYGSWDGALIDFDYSLPLPVKRARKLAALDVAR